MGVVSTQKARKEYTCGRCGAEIHKGDKYHKIKKFRLSPRYRCINCYPRPSETVNSYKLALIYGVQERIEDAQKVLTVDTIEDLLSALEEGVDTVQEVGEEYEESVENISEYFGDTEMVEELREKSENCEDWANQLQDAQNQIESSKDTIESLIKEREDNIRDYDEITKEIEEKLDEIRSCLDDVTGGLNL